jgi:alpha-L-rhamnosidase
MDRRQFLVAAGALPFALGAQDDLIRQTWKARWITVPGAPLDGYGVYHFRRTFELAAKPASFVVHVSGDNRYQLFANGKRVAWGPARGDLFHWRFETVDLAPYLQAGRNVLAAVVWNFGESAPEAQVTLQTGFVLQGEGVETGPNWKCVRNEAYTPIETTSGTVRG